ncbi:MAG: cyclic nucleotide-binding domain-containing protein [Chloroflexi bacterium]|nr:cyclic nucleotide-binding domain-containing protein [Chloroflexota bacterium]
MSVDTDWGQYTLAVTLEPSEYIFREGDPANSLYILAYGRVAIMKENPDGEALVLGYRDPGELVGEIALLSDSPRTASVMAIEPTRLLTISREDFWHGMHEDPTFQETVIHTLIDQLLEADKSRVTAASWERELFDRLGSASSESAQLAELLRLRQETTRFIVHDLRNPMNLIMTALSVIEMTNSDLPEDSQRFINMAKGGVRRMLSLVDAMLDVEKLETEGSEALNLAEEDIVAVVSEVVERTKPLGWGNKIDLSLEVLADDIPPIQIDRGRIDRVLTNLTDNALKFTPPEGAITLSVDRDGDMILITVNDTGAGIPADERERIFDRFVQTEEGRKASGFGLGLAFCRKAVVSHGGQIWADEGDNGIGTKFTFTLPIN